MTRAGAALTALRRQLAATSESAGLDAELLFAYVLGCGRAVLAAHPERPLSEAESLRLDALAARRTAGEPLAYLIGRREFWSLELEVTRDVMVPRPESEMLVEIAVAGIAGVRHPRVLDLGTGSGALALAIARERPDADLTAVDQSAAALAVAERNASRLGVENVRFLQGDWYGPLAARRFDAIVANPPYLADNDPAFALLAHEPRAALAAGPQGLDALKVICTGAAGRLRAGGLLVVEHGAGQGAAVRALCTGAGLAGVATLRDLAGHERATRGTAA